jgi:hypothetical protein
MSTLSKVFVILNLILGLLFLGVAVTLFATRLDWKAKFFTALNKHSQDINYYIGELGEKEAIAQNYALDIRVLNQKIQEVEVSKQELQRSYEDAVQQYNVLVKDLGELQNHQRALVNQLQVIEKANEDLLAQVELFKGKLGVIQMERDTAIASLQESKFLNEELKKDIGQLEKSYVDMAHTVREQELVLAELERRGYTIEEIMPNQPPAVPVDGRVQAVSKEYNVVILSVGIDEGVKIGNTFTIYRDDKFVSKVVVDKAEKDWSSARVLDGFDRELIKVGDSASNRIYRQ